VSHFLNNHCNTLCYLAKKTNKEEYTKILCSHLDDIFITAESIFDLLDFSYRLCGETIVRSEVDWYIYRKGIWSRSSKVHVKNIFKSKMKKILTYYFSNYGHSTDKW